MLIYLVILYIVLSNSTVYEAIAIINILDKGVMPFDRHSVAIQLYVDVVNEDEFNVCEMRYWPKRCCFIDPLTSENTNTNCETLRVYGAEKHTIKPKDRETLFFIYPTLFQYDQLGSCNFMLNYNCGNKRIFKRDEIDVKFDTSLKTNKNILKDARNTKWCDSLDFDPLNDCKPVDCEMKYMGSKPYFDGYRFKCTKAAICESDPAKDLPDIVYEPKTNTCKDLDNPLTIADIYAISSGLGVVTEPVNISRTQVQIKSNCSTISQHLQILRDMMYGKFYPMSNDVTLDNSAFCSTSKSAFLGVTCCILGLCALLLSFVFCVNTAVWLHEKWSIGDIQKIFKSAKNRWKKCNALGCKGKKSKVNKDVKNSLLKDVIVTDLPMELRDSVLELCERAHREGKWKRRYRIADIGSQVNLMEHVDSSSRTSSTTTLNENNDK